MRAWCALLIALCGCHGQIRINRPRPAVRVLIDPSLPSCEIDAVLGAVRFWRRQGASLEIDAWISGHDIQMGDVSFLDGEIEDPRIYGVTAAIESRENPLAPEVVVAVVLLDSCHPRVAAHELGHALGLRHSTEKGALMFPTVEGGGWRVSISDLDRVRWR